MNAPKHFYVYGAAALFGLGFTLAVLNTATVAAAGAFIGCGLMGIANAVSAFAKPAA